MNTQMSSALAQGDNTPVVLQGANNEVRITSVELVEMINTFRKEEGNAVEKEHSDLMKSIRKEIETLENAGIKDGGNFSLISYQDAYGRDKPCYSMNKAGALQMLNKESAIVRFKTTQYIEKMERALREQIPVLEYNQELQEFDKVAKIIGLSKQDKLVVVLSIMKRHNAPTLGLEELSICTQTKQIKNQQSVNDVIDYICDHNPVGFSIKEYYKNYLLHCAKNGLNPMDKVSLGKIIRQLGYESKCKRVDGAVGKVWFEIGGN